MGIVTKGKLLSPPRQLASTVVMENTKRNLLLQGTRVAHVAQAKLLLRQKIRATIALLGNIKRNQLPRLIHVLSVSKESSLQLLLLIRVQIV